MTNSSQSIEILSSYEEYFVNLVISSAIELYNDSIEDEYNTKKMSEKLTKIVSNIMNCKNSVVNLLNSPRGTNYIYMSQVDPFPKLTLILEDFSDLCDEEACTVDRFQDKLLTKIKKYRVVKEKKSSKSKEELTERFLDDMKNRKEKEEKIVEKFLDDVKKYEDEDEIKARELVPENQPVPRTDSESVPETVHETHGVTISDIDEDAEPEKETLPASSEFVLMEKEHQ